MIIVVVLLVLVPGFKKLTKSLVYRNKAVADAVIIRASAEAKRARAQGRAEVLRARAAGRACAQLGGAEKSKSELGGRGKKAGA
jgi:regulator of protease activity HflC (stomatin/prohibitin superfamily)